MSPPDALPRDLINAFVDGEISREERARLLEVAEGSTEIADRICQLRMMKDMVRVSYQDPPRPTGPRRHPGHPTTRVGQAAAAILLIALGAAGGWYANAVSPPPESLFSSQALQLDPARADSRHLVLHISTADARRVDAALSDAERLLSAYGGNPERIALEVIVNAEGIQILREDTSTYAERIRSLTERYGNIAFVACSRSVERLRLKGVEVHLIREARVIPEALEAIVNRLQQGWVYIRA